MGLHGFRENRGGSFVANRVPWGSYRKLNANLQPMRGGGDHKEILLNLMGDQVNFIVTHPGENLSRIFKDLSRSS